MRHTPPPRPRGFERPVSLSEVLDRVLNKGAVVAGEVVISVAGIDLIYLALNIVVTSEKEATITDRYRNVTDDQHRNQLRIR
ncbi:MAG: hypothetical protein DMG67_07780 [Acidobacteria bacterium]|nr:MAG: hypothetical protein DMG67_07780 [Acidobacteriota bacterium]